MVNKQPNYYQFSKTDSVQCLSAPEPCSSAFVFTGGVALPLLYLIINSCIRVANTQNGRKQEALSVTQPSRLRVISLFASKMLALHFFKPLTIN